MARQCILDLRNIYAVLTDIVHKNIAKVGLHLHFVIMSNLLFPTLQIRSPKGNNAGHMY